MFLAYFVKRYSQGTEHRDYERLVSSTFGDFCHCFPKL